MKRSNRLLAILTACLLLAGCGAAPAPSGGSGAAGAESETAQVTLPTASGGLEALGRDTAFGSGNSSGYYYLSTLDGGAFLLRYIDYATGQDLPLCSQPNCSHSGETCPAWFAYSGTSANVYTTDQQVFVTFNGSPWDSDAFAEYGEAALPRVLTLAPDGSGRREVARFGASDAFTSLPAAGDGSFYTIVTDYGEGEGSGEKRIAAIDLATGKVTTDNSVQRREMRIVGAAGRELVLQSMVSDTLSAYAAYNVDSGELRDLYNGAEPVSAACRDGALILLETKTGTLRRIQIATGQETTLSTDLFSGRSLDFVTLAFVTDAGYVVQAHQGRTAYNFLIDQTGKTTRQELFADSTDPRDKLRMLDIFAQPGGDYLVAPSRSYRTVKVPGPNGISYGIDEPVHAFALISQADFWASKPNYRPVTRLE